MPTFGIHHRRGILKSIIKFSVAMFIVVMTMTACSTHQYDLTLDNQITEFEIKADRQFVTWTAQAMADNTQPAVPVVACQAAAVAAGQTLSLISPLSEPDSQFFNSAETDLALIESRTKALNNNPAIDQQIFGLRNIFYQIKYKKQHCSQQDSPAYIAIQRKQVSVIMQSMLTYERVLKNGSGTSQK
ncbi:hypothetical protein EJP81_12015 [Rahnella aquatilis]|jgi:hypothetical protein|nr:hypothetical protein EJP79_12010 [Rahnella aquatilis]AZP46873.1 hypothetical protein EJP81_12015 [Rahnella aquatilis]MCM2444829.1 hypothetical protein [Rahnella sp. CG8]